MILKRLFGWFMALSWRMRFAVVAVKIAESIIFAYIGASVFSVRGQFVQASIARFFEQDFNWKLALVTVVVFSVLWVVLFVRGRLERRSYDGIGNRTRARS